MGGNVMRMLLVLLATSCIWWGGMSVGAAHVEFTTDGATEKTYAHFLDKVRHALASGRPSYGIPVLPRGTQIHTAKQRFLLVTLTNSAGKSITLALDVVTAAVVGYETTDERSFFFSDAPEAASDLFLDAVRKTFDFKGSYEDLTEVAKADRSTIPLGITDLSRAIQDLHDWSSGSEENLAHGLLVVIQMVSEAARIRYIQRAVANRGLGDDDFIPDCAIISFEDNWVPLSSAIQTSVNGKFRNPIELQRGNCNKYTVTTVTENLKNDLALLKSNLAIPPSSQVISSVVAAEGDETINELIMEVRKFNPGRHNKWFTTQA